MARRFSAEIALQRLQMIDSDNSGDSEVESDDEVNIEVHSDEDISNGSDDEAQLTLHEEQNNVQTVCSPDGSTWKFHVANRHLAGRLPAHNVFRQTPGPTNFARRNVLEDSPLSAFSIFVNESMLRSIRTNTEAEARRRLRNETWTLSLGELDTFLGLIIARGFLAARNLPVKSLWSKEWGVQFFQNAMPRDRFLEILRYLRFDKKEERSERLVSDKFALVSSVWNPFIENCIRAFKPDINLTVDEQLLPCKARCKYIQYMPNKPDKFGLKFWLLVDLNDKYVCNGFPYLGRENDQPRNGVNLSSYVVLKLLQPYYHLGHNVTCDNFFTSLSLAKALLVKNTSIVGTVRSNRREIPQSCKSRADLFSSQGMVEEESGALLTSYQCKRDKKVFVLSTLHNTLRIDDSDNPKKKPNTVVYYNKTKYGVDVADQMARQYSVKCASRRWPLHVFFNIIDLAIINSWILYRKIAGSSISRRQFMQQLTEELTGTRKNHRNRRDESVPLPPTKKRRQCFGPCNKNRTTNDCSKCSRPVCGKCCSIVKTCICSDCQN